MSDELMIQPQVVQPKKDNSALYGTGLGLVGGAGGYYAANKWTGKITSHDDIIKDAKDQVDLKAKYPNADEASVKGVTDAIKEVKEAEAALEAAKKPVLAADAPEQVAYDAAKKAYDEKFNKLVEEETARLEKSGGSVGSENKILDFNKVKDHKEWPAANEKGQAIKTEAQARAYYDKLKADIVKAENNFGYDITRAQDAVTRAEGSINTYLGEVENRFATETDFGKINRKFDRKTFNVTFGPFGEVKWPTGEYGKAFEEAKQLHPEKRTNTLTFADYEKFGTVSDKYVRPETGKCDSFSVYNSATGKNETKWVTYTNDARTKYIAEYNKNLHQTRLNTADELYDIARQHVINQKKLNNFDEIYAKAQDGYGLVGEARKGGLYDAAGKRIMVREMLAENSNNVATMNGKRYKGFHGDVRVLRYAKEHGTTDVSGMLLNGQYGTETNIDKVLNMAEAKQRLYEDYVKSKKDLSTEIRSAKQTTSVVKDLKAKAQGLKNGDSAYSEAIQKFKEAFPTLFKEGEAAGSATGDIAGKAREFAEGKTGDLKKVMEEKLGLLETAKKEKGVVNQEAVKKAEELFTGKQNAAIERAKAFAEKLGKEGGIKGWVGGVVGLALLGGLGYLIGKPSNS